MNTLTRLRGARSRRDEHRTKLVRLGFFARLLLDDPPFGDARALPPRLPLDPALDLLRYSRLLADRLTATAPSLTTTSLPCHLGFLYGLSALVASGPGHDSEESIDRLAMELVGRLAHPAPSRRRQDPGALVRASRDALVQARIAPSNHRPLPAAVAAAAWLYSFGDAGGLSVVLSCPRWRLPTSSRGITAS